MRTTMQEAACEPKRLTTSKFPICVAMLHAVVDRDERRAPLSQVHERLDLHVQKPEVRVRIAGVAGDLDAVARRSRRRPILLSERTAGATRIAMVYRRTSRSPAAAACSHRLLRHLDVRACGNREDGVASTPRGFAHGRATAHRRRVRRVAARPSRQRGSHRASSSTARWRDGARLCLPRDVAALARPLPSTRRRSAEHAERRRGRAARHRADRAGADTPRRRRTRRGARRARRRARAVRRLPDRPNAGGRGRRHAGGARSRRR